MRKLVQFGVSMVCFALIGAGLYLSVGPASEGVLLERPGSPARLSTDATSATAFFELDGDALELTMLFTEQAESDDVFKTRVRLMDGQSHSIVVGDSDAGAGLHRYTFRRVGYTVEMRLAPAAPLAASLNFYN